MTSSRDIARVRAFNRLYVSRIGILMERPYGSDFSLTETRVLYELGSRAGVQPAALARELAVDPAYLSRILTRFRKLGLVERRRSEEDGRSIVVSLTDEGRTLFTRIDDSANKEVGALLSDLPPTSRRALVGAAATIERTLSDQAAAQPPVRFRDPVAGDLGWVIHRQAALYVQEYGWDASFEALLTQILADFTRDFDPAREKAWIADRGGEVVGSVFLIAGDAPRTAKLRLLYVEPSARGLGVGAALVDRCIEQARAFGYAQLELWTNDVLVSARRIYQAAGFALVREERHHAFGCDLVGQYWRLEL